MLRGLFTGLVSNRPIPQVGNTKINLGIKRIVLSATNYMSLEV